MTGTSNDFGLFCWRSSSIFTDLRHLDVAPGNRRARGETGRGMSPQRPSIADAPRYCASAVPARRKPPEVFYSGGAPEGTDIELKRIKSDPKITCHANSPCGLLEWGFLFPARQNRRAGNANMAYTLI